MHDWEAGWITDANDALATRANDTDRELFRRMVKHAAALFNDSTRIIPKRRKLDMHADGVVIAEMAIILQDTLGYTRAFWSHAAHLVAEKERADRAAFIVARAGAPTTTE